MSVDDLTDLISEMRIERVDLTSGQQVRNWLKENNYNISRNRLKRLAVSMSFFSCQKCTRCYPTINLLQVHLEKKKHFYNQKIFHDEKNEFMNSINKKYGNNIRYNDLIKDDEMLEPYERGTLSKLFQVEMFLVAVYNVRS